MNPQVIVLEELLSRIQRNRQQMDQAMAQAAILRIVEDTSDVSDMAESYGEADPDLLITEADDGMGIPLESAVMSPIEDSPVASEPIPLIDIAEPSTIPEEDVHLRETVMEIPFTTDEDARETLVVPQWEEPRIFQADAVAAGPVVHVVHNDDAREDWSLSAVLERAWNI